MMKVMISAMSACLFTDGGYSPTKKLLIFEQSESMEFSLNGAELSLNSGNSENLRNH